MKKCQVHQVFIVVLVLAAFLFASPAAAQPIKIGIIQGLSGPYEIYGKAEVTGFKMGLEYLTKGTNKIMGRDVELIVEDTQLKAARAKMLLTKLYSDDKVDIAVGPTSSGVALAVLPVAQQFKKVLIVEPAVADAITGKSWNRYIFRTGRNSSQDAISNAAAIAKPGVSIACIARITHSAGTVWPRTSGWPRNWAPRWFTRNTAIPKGPISRRPSSGSSRPSRTSPARSTSRPTGPGRAVPCPS
jgi:branched-chain amino acid transport system substrate-binding protein